MFLVLKINKWDDTKLEQLGKYSFPVHPTFIKPNNGSIGYAELFDTKENALKEYPGAEVIEMKEYKIENLV